MKCLDSKCEAEIESDDNFCHQCGHWTAKGYTYLKDKSHLENIMKGEVIKQDEHLLTLYSIVSLSFITFFILTLIRGNNLFKPIFYLKQQINNYKYGYNTTIIKTNNTYTGKTINTLEDAYKIIKEDSESQSWQCNRDQDSFKIETYIEKTYQIQNVNLCEIPYQEAEQIKEVIEKMYNLFPNLQGSLTNISITNANTSKEYIAYFQPMFQFVNSTKNINTHNKVNKTQILLNSYYFLNKEMLNQNLSNIVGENWYVKDATWHSTIAHELGHYIIFKILLKENNLNNITLVTKTNELAINNILNKFDNGSFSKQILEESLNNYNKKYNQNLFLDSFAQTISKYASIKDENNNLKADETIAEAIHDYYLHRENCEKSSYEIIKVIKSRL